MANKVKQPVRSGIAKTPVVMQLEALECGAASLTMILAYYRKWLPLERVRADCGVSRDGSSAKKILQAARFYGLEAKGYRFEPKALMEQGTFPCIIHWNFNHFVVLCGFKGDKAYINDPAMGAVTVPMKTFDESFTGVCLLFQPTERFEPSGKPQSMLGFAAKRLKGTGAAIAFTVLTSVITSLMGVMTPAFSRVFLDWLLPQKAPYWATAFFVLLAAFNLLHVIVSALQAIFQRRISGKMAAVGSANYMWKVLHMPMDFFSQRMAGDIQGRQASNAGIADTLINTLAPLVLDVAMMVFYLVVMLRYSWLLTLVGLSSLTITALVSNSISKKRVNVTRVSMRDAAKLSSATVAGVSMIETIKSSGAERGYFAKWSGYQASVNTQRVRMAKISNYLGMIPQLANALASNVVLLLGIWLTMRGEFTVGMVMAFQSFLSSFMAPAQKLISAGQTIQEMRTDMERVQDVMEYPDDNVFAPEGSGAEHEDAFRKLSGKLEMKHVSFGYSPLDPPLIKDFDLTLEPGKSVAIVGGSGCGKSTIAKLISGLYRPWDGEILFDGKRHSELEKGVFYGSLAVVDQDIILFEDTIANNIKMWDDSIEDFEMILAARDAQLHDDIMQRPGGYQCKLTEGGKDFSGGQRQRMEIARVLAQDPTLIIMDEATSALDARTEYHVVNAIRDRGIACVVVAHRLSTIRSCDEIIVMEHGNVVDRGTHAELLERCELYRELVTAE